MRGHVGGGWHGEVWAHSVMRRWRSFSHSDREQDIKRVPSVPPFFVF